MRILVIGFAFGMAAMSSSATAYAAPIRMLVSSGGSEERYMPGLQAVEKSGVEAVVEKEVPSARIAEAIKMDDEPTCGVGWFRTREREEFAKFTKAFMQEPPYILIIPKENGDAFARHRTLRSLVSDIGITAPMKKGTSYGKYIDELLDVRQENVQGIRPRDHEGWVQLLAAGRLGWILGEGGAKDEFMTLAQRHGVELAIHPVEDMPPGNKRYFFCSKSVPDDVIGRLNASIEALFPGLN